MIDHLTFDTLVTDIEDNILSYTNVITNVRNGTLDQLYNTTIEQFIEQAMMMPFRRGQQSLDPSEEQINTTQATTNVAALLAVMCDRTMTEVEHDIVAQIKKFPTDDLAVSAGMRQNNRLN